MQELDSLRGNDRSIVINTINPDGGILTRVVRVGRKTRVPRISGIPLSVVRTDKGVDVVFTAHHLSTLSYDGAEPPYFYKKQVVYSLEPGDSLYLRRPRGLFEFRVRAVPDDELANIAALV